MNDRTRERPARPGETCTCGQPATIVFITADHGDVPYCGVPHADTPAPAPDILATPAADATDPRFNWGLVIDVFDALEKHGFRKGDDAHTGRAVGILINLVEVYEGRTP